VAAAEPEPPPEPTYGIECPPGQEVRIPREVVFVLDGSQSMLLPNNLDPATDRRISRALQNPISAIVALIEVQQLMNRPGVDRIDVARQSLIQAVQGAPPVGSIGFIAFFDCNDIRDFGTYSPARRPELVSTIRGVEPVAGTPLARSIEIAAGRISAGGSADDPATIVVVTDGDDSCNGNPCAVAARLARQRPGLTINVLDLAGWTGVECLANQTGGQVYRPGERMDISDLLSEAAGYSGPQACAPTP
jgi:hypothetical protein